MLPLVTVTLQDSSILSPSRISLPPPPPPLKRTCDWIPTQKNKQTFIYATLNYSTATVYCCWWFRNPKANHLRCFSRPMVNDGDFNYLFPSTGELNPAFLVAIQKPKAKRSEIDAAKVQVWTSWVTLIVGVFSDILWKGFKGGLGKGGEIRHLECIFISNLFGESCIFLDWHHSWISSNPFGLGGT